MYAEYSWPRVLNQKTISPTERELPSSSEKTDPVTERTALDTYIEICHDCSEVK